MSDNSNEWEKKLANSLEVEKFGTTEKLYDKWSTDYDKCLQDWGYTAPSRCAKLLNEYIKDDQNKTMKFLDVGCGTGLVGTEIVKHNKLKASVIYGNDISQELLDITKKKSIYSDLCKWDFMQTPYPYQDNTFDGIVCVGVLTYCKDFPRIFNEWVRITKPGSIIIASHRSDLMKDDETFFNSMVATSKWKKLKHLKNIEYLPNNQNYGTNVTVHFYVAQNTKILSKM